MRKVPTQREWTLGYEVTNLILLYYSYITNQTIYPEKCIFFLDKEAKCPGNCCYFKHCI